MGRRQVKDQIYAPFCVLVELSSRYRLRIYLCERPLLHTREAKGVAATDPSKASIITDPDYGPKSCGGHQTRKQSAHVRTMV